MRYTIKGAQLIGGTRFAFLPLVTPPYGSMILLVLQILDALVAWRHGVSVASHLVIVACAVGSLALCASMPMQPRRPSSRTAMPGLTPTAGYASPEDALTLWQWCTVTWIGPVMRVADQRQLHFPDLWTRTPYSMARHLAAHFDRVKYVRCMDGAHVLTIK